MIINQTLYFLKSVLVYYLTTNREQRNFEQMKYIIFDISIVITPTAICMSIIVYIYMYWPHIYM